MNQIFLKGQNHNYYNDNVPNIILIRLFSKMLRYEKQGLTAPEMYSKYN